MTELLYLQDSYLRNVGATITAAEGSAVVLDRTAFFPGGGGQPADTGWLRWPGAESGVIGMRRDGEAVPPAEPTPDWQSGQVLGLVAFCQTASRAVLAAMP